jgi:hypothetical protein
MWNLLGKGSKSDMEKRNLIQRILGKYINGLEFKKRETLLAILVDLQGFPIYNQPTPVGTIIAFIKVFYGANIHYNRWHRRNVKKTKK